MGFSAWTNSIAPSDYTITSPPGLVRELRDDGVAPSAAGPIGSEILARLVSGEGFVLLRDLQVDGLDDAEVADVVTRLLGHVGPVLHQDARGSLVHFKQDDADVPFTFHTDGSPAFTGTRPDILCLTCIRPAPHGGATLLTSAHTAYGRIARDRPAALARLREPFYFDRGRSGVARQWRPGFETDDRPEPVIRSPIFAGEGNALMAWYSRLWIEMGHELADVPLGVEGNAALDAMDEALAAPDAALELVLQPGDAMFVNNLVNLHSRTPFRDEPGRPHRCLVQAWAAWPAEVTAPAVSA